MAVIIDYKKIFESLKDHECKVLDKKTLFALKIAEWKLNDDKRQEEGY